MRKFLMASIAALVMAGTVIAGAGPAVTVSSQGGGSWPLVAMR